MYISVFHHAVTAEVLILFMVFCNVEEKTLNICKKYKDLSFNILPP